MRFSKGVATFGVAALLAGCGGGGGSNSNTAIPPAAGVGVSAPTQAPTATGSAPTTPPSGSPRPATPSPGPTSPASSPPVTAPPVTAPPVTAPPVTPPPTPPPTAAPTTVPTATAVVNATSSPIALTDNPAVVLGDTSTFNAIGSATNVPIDGIACTGPLANRLQHFHDHLTIYVNGKQYALPAAIGIYLPTLIAGPPTAGYYDINQTVNPTACHYDIHVHAGDGVIHVESASATQTFTLKDFLDIWGVAINPLGFLSFSGPTHWYLTKETYPSPYSRSRQVQDITGVDPATIQLSAHLEFTVEVGTPINTPNYQFYDYDL